MLGANESRIEEAIQDSKRRIAWGFNVIPLPDYHMYKKQLPRSCRATIQKPDPGEVYLICKIDDIEILGLCDLGADINIMPMEIA